MADTSDDEPIAKRKRTQPMNTAARYDAIVRHRMKRETISPSKADETYDETVEIVAQQSAQHKSSAFTIAVSLENE